MIFVDSNIPMYLIGASHPHKVDAQRFLEKCVVAEEVLVSDAEVYQEILHRYTSIRRPEFIQPAFDVLDRITDRVFAVEHSDVHRAKSILSGTIGTFSARDALHVAVMERCRISRIMTFDRGFDGYPDIERIVL